MPDYKISKPERQLIHKLWYETEENMRLTVIQARMNAKCKKDIMRAQFFTAEVIARAVGEEDKLLAQEERKVKSEANQATKLIQIQQFDAVMRERLVKMEHVYRDLRVELGESGDDDIMSQRMPTVDVSIGLAMDLLWNTDKSLMIRSEVASALGDLQT